MDNRASASTPPIRWRAGATTRRATCWATASRPAYTYDALGRMVTQNGTVMQYNGDGVLIQAGSTVYTQDLVAPLSQVLSDGTDTYLYGLDRLASVPGDRPHAITFTAVVDDQVIGTFTTHAAAQEALDTARYDHLRRQPAPVPSRPISGADLRFEGRTVNLFAGHCR